jgi:hypothetical protein
MKVWSTVLAAALIAATLTPVTVCAQIPGGGSLPSSMVPDKTALLEQAKKLLAELTAMQQDPKRSAADKSKVDTLLPQAAAVNTELAKPHVEPSRLAQLAGRLGSLQKQVGALQSSVR